MVRDKRIACNHGLILFQLNTHLDHRERLRALLGRRRAIRPRSGVLGRQAAVPFATDAGERASIETRGHGVGSAVQDVSQACWLVMVVSC
jgi:hypothetical protein